MGKTKEERYIISNPDADATSAQTYALYRICGVDVREVGLTKGGASEYIDAAKNGRSRHTRVELAGLEGADVKTQDVHKNYRNDPTPKGYAKSEPKNVSRKEKKLSPEETLAKLLKAHPDLIKTLRENVDNSVDNSREKAAPKPKPKPKPKAKTQAKKAAKPKPEPEPDDTIDIMAALEMVENLVEKAATK